MLLVPAGVFQQGLRRVKARHPEVQGWADFDQRVYFKAIDLLAQSGERGVVSSEEVEAIGETEWAMWPGRLGSLEPKPQGPSWKDMEDLVTMVYGKELGKLVEQESHFLKLLKNDLRK